MEKLYVHHRRSQTDGLSFLIPALLLQKVQLAKFLLRLHTLGQTDEPVAQWRERYQTFTSSQAY
jgi:hypothetical protein